MSGAGASALTLRPRSGPELVDAAITLTRRHFAPLVTLAAISAIVDAATTMLQLTIAPEATDTSLPALLVVTVQLGLGGIVAGALIHAASEGYFGRKPDPAESLRVALGRPWTLAWTSTLMGALIVVGLVLLIIPGLLLAARYFAVFPAVVLEGRSGWAAFRRSHALARDQTTKLLLTVGLAYAIEFALYVGAELLLAGLVRDEWASAFASATVGVLLVPPLMALLVVAYYDARIQKEAFDIEMLAEGTAMPPSSVPVARTLPRSPGSIP